MNLSEAYQSIYSSQEVNEAVKGQDSEMRKAAAAERAAERKAGSKAQSPGREGPSAGKSYADYQKISIEKHDKVTKKNKDVVGLVAKEEVENVEELYKGKHGQSEKEYADSRSPGGKMVSGDSKGSGAEYTHGRRVKAANPGMQPDVGGKTKPKSQGKMDAGTRADLKYRKANLADLKYRKANLEKEELDTFDIVFEILDEEIENALEVMSQLTFDEVQEIAEGDLAAKARAKAVEMGRKRRSSAAYKQGGARGTGKNERAAYNLSNMQNTPNADLGRQKEVDRSSGIGGHMKKALATKGKYNYRAVLDKRDPKKNPKHTANQ